MKRLCLMFELLALFFLACFFITPLFAQGTPPSGDPAAGADLVNTPFRLWQLNITSAMVGLSYLGRLLTAVSNRGGLWGILRAMIMGSSTVVSKSATSLLLCIGLASGALALLSGCASTPQGKVTQIAVAVKYVAYDGATVILKEHPDWRSGFEKARNDLAALDASTNKIDMADVLIIVQRLPIKELQSFEARLAFNNATMLLQDLQTGTVVDLSQVDLHPIVSALREGLDRALLLSARYRIEDRQGLCSFGRTAILASRRGG